jgi:hypothetical protein
LGSKENYSFALSVDIYKNPNFIVGRYISKGNN